MELFCADLRVKGTIFWIKCTGYCAMCTGFCVQSPKIIHNIFNLGKKEMEFQKTDLTF